MEGQPGRAACIDRQHATGRRSATQAARRFFMRGSFASGRMQAHRRPRDIDIAIASLSVARDALILNP
ncbi:hypothetical protein DIE15_09280 [Burkholderia sp. Bp9031]|nr:hypothetical protein DIE15_09280 [Burkholderia sp. Bp9031]